MKRLFYVLVSLCVATSALRAKDQEWKDVRGTTFKGEAIEALGPLALFRVNGRNGRLIPFSALPPEECVRFYNEAKRTPPRATDWSKAESDLGYEVYHHGPKLVKDENLIRAELSGTEPAFYVVTYVSNSEGKSWEILGKGVPAYTELHAKYPDQFAGFMFGIGNSVSDQKNMATSMHVPFYIGDAFDEANLSTFTRIAPGETRGGVIVFHRSGAAIYARDLSDPDKVLEPIQQLGTLLDTIRPDNPAGWKDRAYYLRAIQPVAFATGHSDPVLIGNPFRADGLRQRKVYLVDATIAVGADGKVTNVTINPDEKNTPAAMVAPLADALKRGSLFVAAVQDGKFVAGTYRYRFEVQH